MDNLIFHCSQPILDKDGLMIVDKKTNKVVKKPTTHTLVFNKLNDDTIVVGWAQAHKSDSYSKKIGRQMATDRLNLLKNRLADFPDRKVHQIPTATDEHLPKHVLANNFDYYLNRAVSRFLNLSALTSVNLIFRSVSQDCPVCQVAIDADDIQDSIDDNMHNSLTSAKANAEIESIYLFSTHKNEDGALIVTVQHRKTFYDNGLDLGAQPDMTEILRQITELLTGLAVIEDTMQLIATDLREYEVIGMLRELGVSYDGNLERCFIKDEE